MYRTRTPTDVSWYQPVPTRSLDLIRATGVARSAAILDVGGGASTLVDHLIAAGYTDVTVLDISPSALDHARARLGERASRAKWIVSDVTEFRPARRYELWHDRAVFHFLVDRAARDRYLEVLGEAIAPRGHLILATFGPGGPTRCSGLDVRRYSADDLSALLAPRFLPVQNLLEQHVTPAGATQEFLYGWWQAVR